MATKSFLKDVTIKDKKNAERFLNAIEAAEKAHKNKVNVDYTTIEDKKTIKRIFNI